MSVKDFTNLINVVVDVDRTMLTYKSTVTGLFSVMNKNIQCQIPPF